MITYVPQIYPDELLFSWFCRYFAHSGYPYYVTALDSVLGVRGRKLGYEFSGPISAEFMKTIEKTSTYRELIVKHTMLPYYARYAEPAARKAAIECLLHKEGRVHDLLPFPCESGPRYLMFCPCCAREDRDEHGEPYFHRVHQIRHIGACPAHGVLLQSTGIRIYGNASPRLYAPWEVIPEESCSTSAPEKAVKLAKYLADVFSAPLNVENDTPMDQFMFLKLQAKGYTDNAGTRRKVDKLLKDICTFYEDIPTITFTRDRLHKFLLGNVVDTRLTCLVGMFLEVPPEELSDPAIPEEARRIPKPTPKRNYGNRKGTRARDWDTLDRESLPRLREALTRLYTHWDGRPRRVTDRAIELEMGWPCKRLQLLPLCRAEAAKYKETQPQYWAREITWACRKLAAENQPLNRKHVYDLINIDAKNMEEAWPLMRLYATLPEADAWRRKLLGNKSLIPFSQLATGQEIRPVTEAESQKLLYKQFAIPLPHQP